MSIEQRTAAANPLWGQRAEFGVIESKGIEKVGELVRRLDDSDADLAHAPAIALAAIRILASQLRAVDERLAMIDEEIETWRQAGATAQALKTIPGAGTLISVISTLRAQANARSVRNNSAILR